MTRRVHDRFGRSGARRVAILVLAGWALAGLPMGPLSATSFAAGPEIFLCEEPERYLVVDKLEAMGHLPGLMTGDRPLEAGEVAREARAAGDAPNPFVDGMLHLLRLGEVERADARLRIGFGVSGDGRVPPNAQGFPVPRDGGGTAVGFVRYAPAERVGIQARIEGLAEFDGESSGRLREASVRIGWPEATLEAGRFSLWWGPGRHGALLFDTQAEPLTGLRIRNPRPIPIGGRLRFLGLLQYDLFFARLERDRPVPHSILSGMRLAVKPAPWLEIGLSRAMHFGGDGRDSGLSTWWEAFKGTRVNDPGEEGNQLGGFDLSVTIPVRSRPVRFYLEMAGEDQAEGPVFPRPAKWAILTGIFLPSIGARERGDLRIEYGTTVTGSPGVWYRHEASLGGYAHRYRGQVLGHHMGTDARDLFLEAHWFLLPSSYLEANGELIRRTFPGPAREEIVRGTGGIVAWLTKRLRADGRIVLERVRNEGGVPGADSTDAIVHVSLAYQYR